MHPRKLIAERDVLDAIAGGASEILAHPETLVTPLARDVARERGVRIRHVVADVAADCACRGTATETASSVVAIASDHGGFQMKGDLIAFLTQSKRQILDLGTDSEEAVDYPDFAYAVARAVATGRARFGIMIDGAGIGSAMVCNKVPGIRAACAYNEFTAWNARAHNDANVLTLGSRTLGIEVCKRIAAVFLETDFEGGRHVRRVDKISDVEALLKT